MQMIKLVVSNLQLSVKHATATGLARLSIMWSNQSTDLWDIKHMIVLQLARLTTALKQSKVTSLGKEVGDTVTS